MKIIAPINRIEDLEPMAAAGADEFYCSVLPPKWLEHFNTSAISRRAFGNLPEFRNLKRAVESAHRLDKRLNLVINAQHYTEAQTLALVELASEFDHLSGDAVIVGDPVLLHHLARKNFGFSLHLSSIASCRNQESAKFFNELGVKRIIFPRDMTLQEMAIIARELPDIEFESFILNDGCAFDEGSCHTIHLPGKLGGPICIDNYRTDYHSVDGSNLMPTDSFLLEENESLYQKWLWNRFSRGFSVTEEGYPYGPCGLCAIPALIKSGITSIKIAGRDSPTERKVKSVQMVRQVLDKYQDSGSEEQAIDCAIAIRNKPGYCVQGYMCYYPESRTTRARNTHSPVHQIKTISL